ncbi:MAG: phosphoglucomutase/phosphomannomutase family protein [Oscillospiraceae bacterium]|nr:phosphoglucomutase/phosphomannomutase family protein [Oscillospiraceae bacterium]
MIKFGTGGWRAVIADDFTKENIRLLTAGLCRLMDKEGYTGSEVCVGYDRRFLAKESAHWAAEVLAGSGYRVVMVNRSSPTPLIMHTVKTRNMPYGMMVTASHNPAIYNGIKVFTAGGRDADETVTGKIEAEIAGLSPADVKSVDYDEAVSRSIVREENPTNQYIDSILSMVDVNAIKNAQLKIALDPMYGVSETSLKTILLTCRCDVSVIHDRHDTLFGGKLPAPNASTLVPLSHFVTDNYCDLGIATDGDADRIGVIDGQGNFVHPNALLTLLYYYLVKYRDWTGPCVRNNSTTHLLDRVAEGLGQKCYEVPVGFKYISAKMTETDAVIGGESSGGLTVRGHISGKDGIYAAALLAEMLAVTGKSLSALYSEITEQYGELSYLEADFKMTEARKAELRAQIYEGTLCPDFGREIARVTRGDGCKVYFADGGWVICRFSGTEPLLRMAAESDSREAAQASIDAWRRLLAL